MQKNIELTVDGSSPMVPIISLSLFAIASGFLMSLIPLALKANAMPESLASWLASIFYAGLLTGSFISARIVGKLTHRVSIVVFLLIIAANIFLISAFPISAVWLIARFLTGVAVAGVFVAIESWLLIADTEKMRAKRLGMYMTALYGGSAFGQLGIGVFGTDGNLPLIIVAALMIAAALPPVIIQNGQPPAMQYSNINVKEMRLLPSAAYIGCVVSGLLIGAVYGLLPVELNMHFEHDQVGSLMAVVVLGGMLIQPVTGWLNSRVEKSLLMAFFSLLGILAIAIIEVATVHFSIILGLFILGAAVFALYPIAITLACQGLCTSKIIAATELMLLSFSLGSVIGPIIAGSSLDRLNSLMPYLLLCFASTLVFMLIFTRRYRRKATLSESSITPGI